MLDLGQCYQLNPLRKETVVLTLVTAVPEMKNTPSRKKKMLQGCIACMMAVRAATTMPAGVKDFRDQAL